MNGLYTILLLVLSNIFMTLAWYGHLKLQQTGVSSNWPLIGVIVFSWAIAFFEYCCQVPANRKSAYRSSSLPSSPTSSSRDKACTGITSPHSSVSSPPSISCL